MPALRSTLIGAAVAVHFGCASTSSAAAAEDGYRLIPLQLRGQS